MDEAEISEVAIRLHDINRLQVVYDSLKSGTGVMKPLDGDVYEIHPWERLSPFASIIVLVNIVTYVIKFVLIAIVLISILNIMMMAVYERTKEIGTISAMGTPARRIQGLFLMEGLALGTLSLIAGLIIGELVIIILNSTGISFKVGPFMLPLSMSITLPDMVTITATVVLVSILASLQPAFKASRLNPVDALGHV